MAAILVVDDEFGLAEVLAAMLTDHGYRVSVALDGREGLARLRKERFDLVLLDLMMPGMDGPATLAAIRAEACDTALPVILMSEVRGLPPLSSARVSTTGW